MPIVRRPAQHKPLRPPSPEPQFGGTAAGAAPGAKLVQPDPTPVSPAPARRRGHAQKSADGKWLPTGSKGFAAPPSEHQFKKGGRGGPGRPRGSVSTDTLWRKEFETKRSVRIDGKTARLSGLQLTIKAEMKDSHMGVRSARKTVLEVAERLYPAPAPAESSDAQAALHHELDRTVLRQFFGGLSLGEPAPLTTDFLSDALATPFGTDAELDGEWSEGEWDAPGEEAVRDE